MAQKKKKPKVVLKKTQVIILAVAIVAVCVCMLAVVTLTAPESRMYFPITAEKNGASDLSPEDSSQEIAQQRIDVGVAKVIAQLEAAEKRAQEAEQGEKEAEKGAFEAQVDGENTQKWITEIQNHATQQQATSNTAPSANSSSTNLALGSKDRATSLNLGKTGTTTSSPSSARTVVGKDYTIPPARSGATLTFVFDDGGQNLSDLQHYLNLPFPVDVAVLPQLQHSVESAHRVRSSGRHELLLHQPMQARNLSVNPGPGAISPSMTTTDIDAVVRKNLAEIGPVSGLNNHEGSLITESKVKVGKVIEICQQQGIFFLDSRTSANTAAPQAALELGAKIWERDVFLDNTQNRADILEQIQRGLEVANKKGYAIYIGHVWSGSNLAQILQELYPVLKSQGYIFSTVGGLYENFGD